MTALDTSLEGRAFPFGEEARVESVIVVPEAVHECLVPPFSRFLGLAVVKSSIKLVWVISLSSANSAHIAFSMVGELAIMLRGICLLEGEARG